MQRLLPEVKRARRKAYEQANRWRFTRATKLWRQRKRLIMFDALGSKCVKCGYDDRRALVFDHINGGGRREMRAFGHTDIMLNYYSSRLDVARQKLQVLCANCNMIKWREMKEFRHE